MDTATILPIPHLHLADNETYNMALAHLVEDEAYADWFRMKSSRGDFILMDNGVVELGYPMESHEILARAREIGASEVVLPDYPLDRLRSMETHRRGLEDLGGILPLMAVPQGSSCGEWRESVLELIRWPVNSIGVSRFVVELFPDRLHALCSVPELLDSDKEIHLLGCPGIANEVALIDMHLSGRIRGIDSGIAAIYAQEGIAIDSGEPKPNVELDFTAEVDEDLLKHNVEYWRREICYGYSLRSVL